jgi:hypothetical protein
MESLMICHLNSGTWNLKREYMVLLRGGSDYITAARCEFFRYEVRKGSLDFCECFWREVYVDVILNGTIQSPAWNIVNNQLCCLHK